MQRAMSDQKASQQKGILFHHVVGATEQRGGHADTKCLRGRKVDREFILVRGLHWQISRSLALQNTINIAGRAPILVDCVIAKRDQAPRDEDALRPRATCAGPQAR
jgi:hypothetical protein